MPVCSPLTARMWESPEEENNLRCSVDIPSAYPNNRAFKRACSSLSRFISEMISTTFVR